MSSSKEEDARFSYSMVVDCMMAPLRKRLKSVKNVTVEQIAGDIQTVEAIVHMIMASSQISSTDVPYSKEEWDKVITTFVKDVCLPILYSIQIVPDSSKGNSEKVKAYYIIIHSISSCLSQIKDDRTVCKLIFHLLSPLSSLNMDDEISTVELKKLDFNPEDINDLDTLSSIKLFTNVLNDKMTVDRFLSIVSVFNINKDALLKHFFHSTLKALELDKKTFSKSLIAISKLLPVCSGSLRKECLSEIWHRFTQPIKRDINGDIVKEAVWQSLFAFYCFKDFFFPLEKSQSDIIVQHLGDEFWSCIQTGLLSIEPSHRKLSMYLLKRLVDTCDQNGCIANAKGLDSEMAPIFWWHKEYSSTLSDVWETLILLIETLEEKQVHVIKPVLSRMKKILALYSNPAVNGMYYLHASWLKIIIIRCFQHESHFMSRWGAVTLLTLDFQHVPLIKHGQMKFLSQGLLDHLQEGRLYSRYTDTELGKCSPVGEALSQFFAKLFTSLNCSQKVECISNVLQKMLDNTWGSVPMFFIIQGLSNIPPEPLLGIKELQLIRDVLHSCLSSHEVQARGAKQCFLGQMIINLINLNTVGPLDFFMTLSGLNRDESFKRGTSLWENVSIFLQSEKVQNEWDDKKILKVALEYLKPDETGSTVFDGRKVNAVSRMLLLFADATIRSFSMANKEGFPTGKAAVEKFPLGIILNEMHTITTNIRSRSYISVPSVDACLALMQCLGKETGDVSNSDHVGLFIKAKLGQTFPHAVSFVIRRLSQDLIKPQDLDEIKFYSDVMLTLGIHCVNPLPAIQEIFTFVTNAFNLTSQQGYHSGVDILCASAMRVLHKILKAVYKSDALNNAAKDVVKEKMSGIKSILSLPLPFSKRDVNSNESFSRAQVGYVISCFLTSSWRCVKLMLLLGYRSSLDLNLLLECSMEAMSLGSGRSDIAVIEALELIIEQAALEFPTLIPPLLDLAWRKIMDEKNNIVFREKLEALVRVALHPSLIEPNIDEDIQEAVDQFAEKMFTLGEKKSGVIYALTKHLCESSLLTDDGRRKAQRVIPFFLQACDYGLIYKKEQKLMLDIFIYIDSFGPDLATNQITNSYAKHDVSARIMIINWLADLKPTNPSDHQFAMTFMRALCSQYLEHAELTTYRHFTNSLSHRRKHRMVLIFTLLSDFIKEEDCPEFLPKLMNGLNLECHPSITHNLEWIVMRLYIRYPSMLSSLWDAFSQFVQKRSVSLCSLFLIISHIGPKLPQKFQSDFYDQAFPTVVPWTLAHHYTTRIFAQTCMIYLWQQCSTLNIKPILEKFSLVKTSVEFINNNGNASNTVGKLLDNFIMSGFDPVRDFSAESIFYTLPRLALISDDEWISPQQLMLHDEKWREGTKLLPLFNTSSQLSSCKEGPWKIKVHVEIDGNSTTQMNGDFQKKIMPWKQMLPDEEAENELASEKLRRDKDGLVVVTSLIDKTPNLGGLCRTSEIFGASEFVIGSMRYLDDAMFQSLSVSAQKWLPITEVLPLKLPDYLAEKRRDGYTLVGVEQTAHSVSLDDYTFPKKSLLVLGNEKEGIPPDMIQNLDVCVEIPQRGIIRSLNVHVCGALIVWEYTRQHLKDEHITDKEI